MDRARTLLWCTASTVWLAWLVGCVVNDRWAWSQWLWWIPAQVAVVASLAALGCSVRTARARRRRFAMSIGMVCAASVATSDSFRFASRAVTSGSLPLVVWNARWPGDASHECARALASFAGHVIVVANPGRVMQHADEWTRPTDAAVSAGQFVITGPVRVVEATPVFMGEGGHASFFRFVHDTAGEFALLAIDLPSDPRRPRWESLQRFARQVGQRVDLARVDLIVGDFNTTRGSASVAAAWPEWYDAWSVAGEGGAWTWPREWPCFAIDMALCRSDVHAERCVVVDPGVGFHRMQTLRLRRNN